MQYDVTTAPTTELLTAQEAARYLRLGKSRHDEWEDLKDLIKAIREEMEADFGRSLTEQTVTLWLDGGEVTDPFFLPLPPAISITSITLFDADNASTAVPSSDYRLTALDPGRVQQAGDGFSSERTTDSARVVYQAGYGSAATDIPYILRVEARRRLWHYWHEARGKAAESPVVWNALPGVERYKYDYL